MAELEQSSCGSLREGPVWLSPLLQTEFFGHCKKHTTGKHEKNQFCLSCCSGPYCPQGLSQSHSGHMSIQVRKASHRDVVRITDMQKYLDLSNIQPYTINGAKIVFLQSRPQPKLCKGAATYCDTCHRSLADQVRFCSINCKLVAIQDASEQDTELKLSPTTEFQSVQGGARKGGSCGYLRLSITDGTDSANHETTSFSPSTPKRQGSEQETSLSGLEMPPFKRQKTLEDVLCPFSPMSVLGSGAAFGHDWIDCYGPSTPERSSELSPRMHSRKQCHPVRAPFFWAPGHRHTA